VIRKVKEQRLAEVLLKEVEAYESRSRYGKSK
jgi:hypothetical protein